ncbi:hypothetical protein [Microvirga tunisiensis]|uniref:hypothetical protein n=1 Tax=Microvirga tunisiensis TaxID=2108360 RepID=UPI001FCEE14C|nr:hypothetical protein [Microvirga tunisiensis]
MAQKTELHRKPDLVAGTTLAQYQIKIVLAEGIVLDDQLFLPRHPEHELAFILSQQATLCHCTPLHGPGLVIDRGRGPGRDYGIDESEAPNPDWPLSTE